MTDRRTFIKQGALGLLALPLLGGEFRHDTGAPLSPSKSRVVVARDPQAVDKRNRGDARRVAALFNGALLTLTGAPDVPAAWKRLGLNAQDSVAVKLNCNTWTVSLFPHPELVSALCASLAQVIPPERIICYERSSSDLRDGGFTINRDGPGVRFYGNDEGGGYSMGEELTQIITDSATKLVNLCSLKTIEFGDIAASLFFKNHIGSLRDEDMPRCHGNAEFMVSVNARPSIRLKTMLNLCDGLRGSYRRGVPWYAQSLILGRDPVAAETICYELINAKRTTEGLKELPQPRYLALAMEKYRLGNCRPEGIEKMTFNPA